MVTALGLNVSDVSLAAAVDAAVQFVPFDLLAPRAASYVRSPSAPRR